MIPNLWQSRLLFYASLLRRFQTSDMSASRAYASPMIGFFREQYLRTARNANVVLLGIGTFESRRVQTLVDASTLQTCRQERNEGNVVIGARAQG